MGRKIHICGNWKMNQTVEDINTFFTEIDETVASYTNCECWIAPQHIHIPLLQNLAKNKNKIQVGSQNCSHVNDGAYTGDISPKSLNDLKVPFTLIGHSERRSVFNESNETLNTKTLNALKNNLKVIFCCGETLEERESGNTEKVVQTQLDEGLKNLPKDMQPNIIVAYEPVWAIGTGKTASPAQAQDVHAFIRKHLSKNHNWNEDELIIQYGGSVKPSNVDELLNCPDIDGALVGGASLKAADFDKLCASGHKH